MRVIALSLALLLAQACHADPLPETRPYFAAVLPIEHTLFRRATNGYNPVATHCGIGDTCAQACGAGYTACDSTDNQNHCFNPSGGQTCCPNGHGDSCEAAFTCAADTKGTTVCCPAGLTLVQCAQALNINGDLVFQAPSSSAQTSSPSQTTPTAPTAPTTPVQSSTPTIPAALITPTIPPTLATPATPSTPSSTTTSTLSSTTTTTSTKTSIKPSNPSHSPTPPSLSPVKYSSSYSTVAHQSILSTSPSSLSDSANQSTIAPTNPVPVSPTVLPSVVTTAGAASQSCAFLLALALFAALI